MHTTHSQFLYGHCTLSIRLDFTFYKAPLNLGDLAFSLHVAILSFGQPGDSLQRKYVEKSLSTVTRVRFRIFGADHILNLFLRNENESRLYQMRSVSLHETEFRLELSEGRNRKSERLSLISIKK